LTSWAEPLLAFQALIQQLASLTLPHRASTQDVVAPMASSARLSSPTSWRKALLTIRELHLRPMDPISSPPLPHFASMQAEAALVALRGQTIATTSWEEALLASQALSHLALLLLLLPHQASTQAEVAPTATRVHLRAPTSCGTNPPAS